MRFRWAAGMVVTLGAACSGPTTPPKPPTDPDPATAPIIRAITVPTSRVEAGVDIALSATVEDAETPLTQLVYQWAANVGTITGSGTTATWTMPRGIKQGADVVITLTVVDTYDALQNNQIVKRQFTVVGTAAPFKVHDSEAETFELARKFLVDLFGNSSIPSEDCMVDFSDVCANLDNGRNDELGQIRDHRERVIVYSARVLAQRVAWHLEDFGSVHTALFVDDRVIGDPPKAPTCGDFEVTVIYVNGRWWICQSYFNDEDTSHCPSTVNNVSAMRFLGKRGGIKNPGIQK